MGRIHESKKAGFEGKAQSTAVNKRKPGYAVQIGVVLVQFWCSSGAVLVQFWCSSGAVLVQFWCSSAVRLQFKQF
jgi:hypothetical protein